MTRSRMAAAHATPIPAIAPAWVTAEAAAYDGSSPDSQMAMLTTEIPLFRCLRFPLEAGHSTVSMFLTDHRYPR